jgi:glycosyltransferase involved in cell wall biosynthesis
VDDGSSDDTVRIVQAAAAADSRVRSLVLAHSGRPAVSRNAGLELASGDFVCFLDGDDLVHSEKFALLDEAVLKSGEQVDVLFHDYADFPNGTEAETGRRCLNGTALGEAIRAMSAGSLTLSSGVLAFPIPPRLLVEFLLARSFVVNTGTICVRRNHLIERGIKFPTDRVVGEDTVVWMQCILDARVVLVDACLFYWRKYVGSLTGRRSVKTQRELVHSLHELFALVEPQLPPAALSSIRLRIFEEAKHVGMLLELEGRRWAAAGTYLVVAVDFRRIRVVLRSVKALVRPASRRPGALP